MVVLRPANNCERGVRHSLMSLNAESIRSSLLTSVSSNMRTGNMITDLLMVTIFSSLFTTICEFNEHDVCVSV